MALRILCTVHMNYGGNSMKIVVVKPPKFISSIFRLVFGIKKIKE